MEIGKVVALTTAVGMTTLGSLVIPIGPAAATRDLGGVDLYRYCQTHGYPDGAVLVQSDAFGWRCASGSERVSINMYDACRWQYALQSAMAAYRNFSDPNSWYCYLP